jgi:4-alpha-glucanotransferase/(1->4)-alpha-D-glucan 1-alpha-D-glucosylmutase
MSAELTVKIREGRRQEFARFGKFAAASELPDPAAVETFQAAKLDWSKLSEPAHASWLAQYRQLLAIRHRDIAPLIPDIRAGNCMRQAENGAFAVAWSLGEGSVLHLIANLTAAAVPAVGRAAGRVLFATHADIRGATANNERPPWSVTWLLEGGRVGS